MRLQLPKNANPENPHKYWVFGACRSYTVAAEQKARTTYENVLRLVKDPDVVAPLEFLRQREINHYQRFGESLGKVLDHLNSKNYYAFNPAFDPKKVK